MKLEPQHDFERVSSSASCARSFSRRYGYFLALLVLLFTGTGCVVNFAAQYDPVTDQSLMSIHRTLESFFGSMERKVGTPAASYDSHLDFYAELKLDVAALQLRVDSVPDNELTQKSVALLGENVELLETLHQEGIDSIELLDIIREDFATALRNMLRFELAKKR